MNLLLSADQEQIVDTLRSFLSAEAPVARFRPPAPQVGNADYRLWRQLAELGFLGISLSEEQGGIGLSAAEEMLAYREFGRHLVSPAVLGLTLGARIAAHAASDLAEQMLSGQLRVALANPCGTVQLGAECSGAFHLFDGHDAPYLLICAESGAALLRRDNFTAITPVAAMDSVLHLERARLERARPLLWMEAGVDAIQRRARLLIGAYSLGIAEATRDMAVAYAKQREQFGKPIGSFQAIKHICADMAIRAEAALCQITFAALALSDDLAAEFHTVAGKLVATDAALKNAAQNIQVHGAIGFTAEADAHLYLKRAHVMDQLWGDMRVQREHMLAAAFPD